MEHLNSSCTELVCALITPEDSMHICTVKTLYEVYSG